MTEEEKLSRRERRAAEKGNTGDAEPKDRNARVRESVTGKRKSRERERAAAAAEGLGATEVIDNVLTRGADKTERFVRTQFPWLQWVILALFAGLVALFIFNFRKGKDEEKLGARLAKALDTADGRLTVADPTPPADRNLVDTRPEFASEAARSDAALAEWKALGDVAEGELAAYAELGRAATFLDVKKWAEAQKLYESMLTRAELKPEQLLRAREGVGLALEGAGKLAEAKAAFQKLKDAGAPQSKELSRFHVARVNFLLGEKAAALEELNKLKSELNKGVGVIGDRGYLSLAVDDLLKTVDPKASQSAGGTITPEQLEQLKQQLEAMQKGGGMPGAPGSNAPAGPAQ